MDKLAIQFIKFNTKKFDTFTTQCSILVDMKLKSVLFLLIAVTLLSGCSKESGEGPVFEGDYVLSTIDQYNSFNYVHVFGKLIIENLETTDLSNLSSLRSVGGLTIRNSAMTTLEGLNNLEIIAGDLILEGNQNLVSVCCLNQVEQVESLQIIDHPILLTIDGLSGMQTVNDTLRIRSAQQLVSISGLQNLKTVNAPFRLNLTGVESLNGLQSLQYVESVLFQDLPNLTTAQEWSELKTIENDLEIVNCEQLSVLDLPSLQNVSSVFLGNNPALLNADFGVTSSNLEFVSIGSSPNLVSLRGFENVQQIGQLVLSELNELEDLNAFSGLTQVLGNLQLNNLNTLTTLSGFENLISVATEYSGNPPNYTEFSISGMDNLTSLVGLDQLESIGQIAIRNNGQLGNLDGTNLQTTIPIGCRLFIDANPNLTDYCGLTNFVNNVTIDASLIQGNAYDPTLSQIGSGSECRL